MDIGSCAARRLGLAGLLLLIAIAQTLLAADPAWWRDPNTQIIDANAQVNNHAPALVGQLKNVAVQAKKHLDAQLLGGAGSNIDALIESFGADSDANHAPLLLGQLKYVAKPFYQRLHDVGYDTKANLIAHGYPSNWSYDTPWGDPQAANAGNHSPALIGQLKMAFSFDLTGFDTDRDGLPDEWEQRIVDASSTDAIEDVGDVLLTDDFDGDGISNEREFQLGSDPTDARSGVEAALVGRWRFNEGYGNVANDETAGKREAELTGGYAWQEEPGGRKYLRFTDDAGRGEIEGSDFELGAGNADFTVAFWVRLQEAADNTWRVLLHKGNDDNQRTFAMWLIPGTTKIHYRISGATNPNMGGDGATNLPVGTWVHVAYVKEGSSLKLYVNGVLDGTTALGEAVVGNNGPIRIGSNGIHAASKASFDDLQIYGMALSAAEIAMLQESDDVDSDGDGLSDYEEARLGTNKALPDSDWDGIGDKFEIEEGTDPNDPESVTQKRIAYFPFDATDFRSAEGQEPRALGSGQTAATQVSGLRGRAMKIENAGQLLAYDWVRPDGAPNYSMKRGSVRLWFKADWSSTEGMAQSWGRLFDLGIYTDGAATAEVVLHFDWDQPYIHFYESDGNGHSWSFVPSLSLDPIHAGQWEEIVVTYSPTSRKLYLNGSLVNEVTGNWTHAPDLAAFAQYGLKFGSDGGQPVKGAIDEVEIFNYELTSQQITDDYAAVVAADSNLNGIPDDWENTHLDPNNPPDSNWWNADDDGDGLSNRDEAGFGTDPNNPSSNNSGIPDGWAVDHGYGPNTITGDEDDDEGVGDGLSLKEEYESGTDPNKRDSDGDHVIDGEDGWASDKDLKPPRLPESRYAVVDLSQAGAQPNDFCPWVNDNGEIVIRPYYDHTWSVWKDGQIYPVPESPGNTFEGDLVGIDNDGYVYRGEQEFPEEGELPPPKAVKWKIGDAHTTALPQASIPSGATFSGQDVKAVSKSGLAIGTIYFWIPNSPDYSKMGVTWMNGTNPTTVFGPTGEVTDGANWWVFNINNNGKALGQGWAGNDYMEVGDYWDGSNWSRLPVIDEDDIFTWRFGYGINNWSSPVVVGSCPANDHEYATLWVQVEGAWHLKTFEINGRPTSDLQKAVQGSFLAINDRLEAIGGFYDPNGTNFIGNLVRNGHVLDLKNLTSGWGDFSPADINNKGLIVGSAKKLDSNTGETTGDSLPVMLVPINVTIKKQGTEKAPRDGLVVKRFDTVTIQLSDIPQASFIAKAQDIKWYSRRLKTDGTYEAWSEMDGHPRGVSIDYRCDAVGIYQVKCEWSVGTQQFVTNFERSFDDPNTRDDYKLKKGDPDSFGVTETQWQIDLRDKAKSHLGSKDYAVGVAVPPIPAGADKCNIFVAKMGQEANVYIPWINGGILPPAYPPVADQWFGAPPNPPDHPAYEDVLGEFWTITADTHPQPGFIVSRGFYTWGTGHCGIVDYDGRWISASSETDTINRQANFASERGRDLQNHQLLPAMRITTGE